MKPILVILLMLTCPLLIMAQAPKGTDIFIVPLVKDALGNYACGIPENVTPRKGYDNQPSFLPSGRSILYSMIDETGQADVMYYMPRKGLTINVTQTPYTSEYSPTLMPDGKHISVVMVEEDQKTQRLWQVNTLTGEGSLLKAYPKNLGYYCWLPDYQSIAAFLVGKPHTLHLAKLTSKRSKLVTADIGRCLKVSPSNPKYLVYVHKTSPQQWHLKRINIYNYDVQTLARTFKNKEDFVILRDGSILMGDGAKLYRLANGKWREIADFSAYGINDFNRIAINAQNTRIAIVVPEKEEVITEVKGKK